MTKSHHFFGEEGREENKRGISQIGAIYLRGDECFHGGIDFTYIYIHQNLTNNIF